MHNARVRRFYPDNYIETRIDSSVILQFQCYFFYETSFRVLGWLYRTKYLIAPEHRSR